MFTRGRGLAAFHHFETDAVARMLDVAGAIDTYAAITNMDVYETLLRERGWRPEQVERWWHRSLARLLLRS